MLIYCTNLLCKTLTISLWMCLHETQQKVILSKNIDQTEDYYEGSLLLNVRNYDGKKSIHVIIYIYVSGVVQVRSVGCCYVECIQLTGLCAVKHADYLTFACNTETLGSLYSYIVMLY